MNLWSKFIYLPCSVVVFGRGTFLFAATEQDPCIQTAELRNKCNNKWVKFRCKHTKVNEGKLVCTHWSHPTPSQTCYEAAGTPAGGSRSLLCPSTKCIRLSLALQF